MENPRDHETETVVTFPTPDMTLWYNHLLNMFQSLEAEPFTLPVKRRQTLTSRVFIFSVNFYVYVVFVLRTRALSVKLKI